MALSAAEEEAVVGEAGKHWQDEQGQQGRLLSRKVNQEDKQVRQDWLLSNTIECNYIYAEKGAYMARKVIKTAHGPYELKPQGNPVLLCMCGLSKNQPFCDGSHLKTIDEEEGKVYVYDEQGKKQEIGACCQGNGCSCGLGK